MAVTEMTPLPPKLEKAKRKGTSPWKIVRRVFLAAALIAGGKVVVDEANKVGFNPGTIVQDIGNQIGQETNNLIIQNNTDSGYYDLKAPPNRVAETPQPSQGEITLKDIPAIPANGNFSQITLFPSFNSSIGFDGYVDGFTYMNGEAGKPGTTIENGPAEAIITGYLVGEEKQSDGSYLFAVELPNLDGPQDILKKGNTASSPEVKTTDGPTGFNPNGKIKEDVAGGVIVWLNFLPGDNPSHYPFTTITTWGEKEFQTVGLSSNSPSGSGDKGFLDYARVGDQVRAFVPLGMDFSAPMSLGDPTTMNDEFNTYVNHYHYAPSLDTARNEYQQVLDNNLQTAKKLVGDNGKSITFDQQLQEKRYVFTANFIVFIPN
jgi:hypothetical protein